MLSVKYLIKISNKPESKNILDEVCNCQNYSEGNFPVNSFVRRALLWSKLLDITVRRTNSRMVMNAPPWKECSYAIKKTMTVMLCKITRYRTLHTRMSHRKGASQTCHRLLYQ